MLGDDSWHHRRRVVTLLLPGLCDISELTTSRGNIGDESWLSLWTSLLRWECIRRVVPYERRVVASGATTRRFCSGLQCWVTSRDFFWHGLAMTHFFPLKVVWLDLFDSFRGLRPFLQAFALLSLPGPNRTSIPPQKLHKTHYWAYETKMSNITYNTT